MSALRIVYHMARADFLERTRRYSFLITLGLVLFLGYSVASDPNVMVVGGHYCGILNSAWVGGLMAVIINFFLGWFGFYLVKGSVSRDYETGVGQIMATTPLKRLLYTFGKWVSNFVVFGVMVLILMAAAVALQLLRREDPVINLWVLFSPFLLLCLPFLAVVAALAVLFETIEWFRSSLGNIAYFFLYIAGIALGSVYLLDSRLAFLDFPGVFLAGSSMEASVSSLDSNSGGDVDLLGFAPSELETFTWSGMAWTTDLILARLSLVIVAAGIAALAAAFFDRFNPSREPRIKRRQAESSALEPVAVVEAVAVSTVNLTPLAGTRSRFRFDALVLAEFRMLLKGQRWWWYAVAMGLVTAQLFSSISITRTLLVVAWVWPVLLLSGLGCRESRYDTRQIVSSAPRPLMNQLPAAWLSAFVLTALLGSGAFLRFIMAGETLNILGWLTGIFFIPSLALACGVLTGSNKTFEVLCLLWMYMIIQKVSLFDFIGMTPASPLYLYAPLALALLVLAVAARGRQLKRGLS